MARGRGAHMGEALKQTNVAYALNDGAANILDPFLALDATDPANCLAYCEDSCAACASWPEGLRDQLCAANRCGLREAPYFQAHQLEIRHLWEALQDPELLNDEGLAALNQRTWAVGSATPQWERGPAGELRFRFASETLLSRLHGALHLALAVRVGVIFANLGAMNATQIAHICAEVDRSMTLRQKALVRRLHRDDPRWWNKSRLGKLVGRHRDTVDRWLAQPEPEPAGEDEG